VGENKKRGADESKCNRRDVEEDAEKKRLDHISSSRRISRRLCASAAAFGLGQNKETFRRGKEGFFLLFRGQVGAGPCGECL
jgi:hypothetical protein